MTTTKQLDYLTKLSNWKSTSLPDDIESWSDDQASDLIDEWKALKSNHGAKRAKQTRITMTKSERRAPSQPATFEINGMRLGKAFKLVMQQSMIDKLDIADMERVCERVWLLYQLEEAAEAYVQARLNKERGPR